MANKKATNAERDQQIGWLTGAVNRAFGVLSAYIEFKGDEVEFKKFLIEKEAEAKKQMEKSNDTEGANKVSTESS